MTEWLAFWDRPNRIFVNERHRHRYEVNNHYIPRLEAAGLRISARTKAEALTELIELPGHPWFVGCQYHPEFCSTPRAGHPLFTAYIRAALAGQDLEGLSPVAANAELVANI